MPVHQPPIFRMSQLILTGYRDQERRLRNMEDLQSDHCLPRLYSQPEGDLPSTQRRSLK